MTFVFLGARKPEKFRDAILKATLRASTLLLTVSGRIYWKWLCQQLQMFSNHGTPRTA